MNGRVATIETRRSVLQVASSQTDLHLAVVENSPNSLMMDESIIRLYDIGRLRVDEEDDADDNDGEDDEENDPRDDSDAGERTCRVRGNCLLFIY